MLNNIKLNSVQSFKEQESRKLFDSPVNSTAAHVRKQLALPEMVNLIKEVKASVRNKSLQMLTTHDNESIIALMTN